VADRADEFGQSWPEYSVVLKRATGAVQERLQKIEAVFAEIAGQQQKPAAPAAPAPREESPVRSLLLRGLGGLYTALLALSFIPFLVFFMLAGKRDLWHGTMQLFPPSERTRVRDALEAVSRMLRGFIVGNLIVALILATLSAIFFRIIGLDYPILLGVVSGVLNLVPYIGVVLAWLPPLLIGLTKFQLWGLVGIAVVLSILHLIAINFLVPALVGRKVHLNALTVTIALLFWGWLWGGMGLILAIPIMATVKVVCDHVEDWQPAGRWLGT
jgi:predicted PurR-regulated permease PerM